jgi:hypothetical protein
MKMNVTALTALLILASAGGALAFQELPSVEIAPYVGFLKYDSALDYDNTLAYGLRADFRVIPYFGLQLHYARSSTADGITGFPFGADKFVSRAQVNITYDLLPMRGFFVHLLGGVGSFNRHIDGEYQTSTTAQLGLGARRNLFGDLYVRGDLGWIGAWIEDSDPESDFAESTLTNNLEVSLTLSYLLDN